MRGPIFFKVAIISFFKINCGIHVHGSPNSVVRNIQSLLQTPETRTAAETPTTTPTCFDERLMKTKNLSEPDQIDSGQDGGSVSAVTQSKKTVKGLLRLPKPLLKQIESFLFDFYFYHDGRRFVHKPCYINMPLCWVACTQNGRAIDRKYHFTLPVDGLICDQEDRALSIYDAECMQARRFSYLVRQFRCGKEEES